MILRSYNSQLMISLFIFFVFCLISSSSAQDPELTALSEGGWVIRTLGGPAHFIAPGFCSQELLGLSKDGYLGLFNSTDGNFKQRYLISENSKKSNGRILGMDRHPHFISVVYGDTKLSKNLKNSNFENQNFVKSASSTTHLIFAQTVPPPPPAVNPRAPPPPPQPSNSFQPFLILQNLRHFESATVNIASLTSSSKTEDEKEENVQIDLPTPSEAKIVSVTKDFDVVVTLNRGTEIRVHMLQSLRDDYLRRLKKHNDGELEGEYEPVKLEKMRSSHGTKWPLKLIAASKSEIPDHLKGVYDSIIFENCRIVKIWDQEGMKNGVNFVNLCPLKKEENNSNFRLILFSVPFDYMNSEIEFRSAPSSSLILNFASLEDQMKFIYDCFSPSALSANSMTQSSSSTSSFMSKTCSFSSTSVAIRPLPEKTKQLFMMTATSNKVTELSSIVPQISPDDKLVISFFGPKVFVSYSETANVQALFSLKVANDTKALSATRFAFGPMGSFQIGSVYSCPTDKSKCILNEEFVHYPSGSDPELRKIDDGSIIKKLPKLKLNKEDSSIGSFYYMFVRGGYKTTAFHSDSHSGELKMFEDRKETSNDMPMKWSLELQIGNPSKLILLKPIDHSPQNTKLIQKYSQKSFFSAFKLKAYQLMSLALGQSDLSSDQQAATESQLTYKTLSPVFVDKSHLSSEDKVTLRGLEIALLVSGDQKSIYGIDTTNGKIIYKKKIDEENNNKNISLTKIIPIQNSNFVFVSTSPSTSLFWLDAFSVNGNLKKIDFNRPDLDNQENDKNENSDYIFNPNGVEGVVVCSTSKIRKIISQKSSKSTNFKINGQFIPVPHPSKIENSENKKSIPKKLMMKTKKAITALQLVPKIENENKNSEIEIDVSVLWSFKFGQDEILGNIIISEDKDGAPIVPVIVRPDAKTLRKINLDNSLVLITTTSSIVSIYFVSSETGAVFLSQTMPEGTSPIMRAILYDNVFVCAYENMKKRRIEMKVVEFFSDSPEPSAWQVVKENIFKLKSPPSSSDGSSTHSVFISPLNYDQSFILPFTSLPSTLGVTSTQGAVTPRSLVAHFSDGNSLVRFDSQFLTARRLTPKIINSKNQQTELSSSDSLEDENFDPAASTDLPPYQPLLQLHQGIHPASRNLDVAGIKHIQSAPRDRESASMVVGSGVDTFMTVLIPSQPFDSLSSEFPFVLVVVTLTCLAGAVYWSFNLQLSKKAKALFLAS